MRKLFFLSYCPYERPNFKYRGIWKRRARTKLKMSRINSNEHFQNINWIEVGFGILGAAAEWYILNYAKK